MKLRFMAVVFAAALSVPTVSAQDVTWNFEQRLTSLEKRVSALENKVTEPVSNVSADTVCENGVCSTVSRGAVRSVPAASFGYTTTAPVRQGLFGGFRERLADRPRLFGRARSGACRN